jgi:hypothetical protein
MSASTTCAKMTTPQKTVGVKGSDVFSGTGDPRLDLNVKLVRGADPATIEAGVLAAAGVSVVDTAVMTFNCRNVRGGKGERDLFRHMLLALNKDYPDLVRRLVELTPAYGCWRDMFALAGDESCNQGLRDAIYAHTVSVLQADAAAPAERDGKAVSISLAAKWVPREDSAGALAKMQARVLARLLFPAATPFSAQMKAYRKLVSGLNARLKTVETLMSAGRWDEIAPPSVPGRAGKLYTRAFLNLVNTKRKGETLKREDRERLRHPDDLKRMVCRGAFQVHYGRAKEGKAKVHGADTLFPHEVVKAVVAGGDGMEESQKDHLRAVWRSMVEKARAAGGLRRSIFMSDFSGSMQSTGQGDTPYWVSMALGLLGAEVVEGDGFANRFLTFDSDPTWHELPADGDVFDRVASISGSIGQGTSTDFQKAMDQVLARLKAQRIRPGEEPENLIVLTDMGWDQASSSAGYGAYTGHSYRNHFKHAPWETHVEMIRESFKRAGEDMWGSQADGGLGGWAMPRIVIWNLAASPAGQKTDFHATADTPGVAMLSGWSPTQFKVLCEAGPRQLTPLEILRIELDDPQYDPVRRIVAKWECPVDAAEGCITCDGEGGWGGAEALCHPRSFAGHADGWGAEDV